MYNGVISCDVPVCVCCQDRTGEGGGGLEKNNLGCGKR